MDYSTPRARPRLFEVPSEVVNEVPLSHPQFPWFEKMGLRWYGIPVVSDMCLDAAGEVFSAAPFNGWYMGTEIAREISVMCHGITCCRSLLKKWV